MMAPVPNRFLFFFVLLSDFSSWPRSRTSRLKTGVADAWFLFGDVAPVERNGYAKGSAKEWILLGGLTEQSAWVRVYQNSTSTSSPSQLVVATDESLSSSFVVYQSDPLTTQHQPSTLYDVHALHVQNLEPDTRYHYGLVTRDDDSQEIRLRGRFRTPAPPHTPWNFTVALAGCAKTGSQRAVFDVMRRDEQPDLILHLGDIHYEDLVCDCLERRLEAVHTVLASRPQAELYRSAALAYMWDDHDWFDNNSGAAEAVEGARDAALRSYQILFPHHDLPALLHQSTNTTTTQPAVAAAVPTYHAFTMGTVRFIVSDLRSESNETAIYSDTQQQWLQNELRNASQYDFVIWVTTKPFIGEVEEGSDSWFGYPEDRRELSNFITEMLGDADGPQNLLAVAADVHSVAFDDGTNTYYGSNSSESRLSFPILHSGPLDQYGSSKGGPYSDGCHAYDGVRNHQYSVIRFEIPDSASSRNAAESSNNEPTACMNIESYRVNDWDAAKELIFSKRLCGQIFAPSRSNAQQQGTCEIKSASLLKQISLVMIRALATVAGVFVPRT